MRKIIFTSAIVLSSLFSLASNGEKEMRELNLYNSIEKISNVNENTFFSGTNSYRIMVRIFICGPNGIGTDWFQEVLEYTPCITDAQLDAIKSSYNTIYGILHPEACNFYIFEELISNCN